MPPPPKGHRWVIDTFFGYGYVKVRLKRLWWTVSHDIFEVSQMDKPEVFDRRVVEAAEHVMENIQAQLDRKRLENHIIKVNAELRKMK